jgi:WD40 repeat protein/GTPase SAR1 family protein
MASFKFDVFLSHNKKDKPRVRRLADRLKAAGLRVWFDDWMVGAGDLISLKVDEGLEQSRVLVLCISQNALRSGWVALERSTAIHRDPTNEDRRFIPLLLSDCKLPDTLSRYRYVDFREDGEASFAELLVACSPAPGVPITRPKRTKPQTKDTVADNPIEPIRTLEGHTSSVFCLAITPDGKTVISASFDQTLRVWDFETGECRQVLKGHSDSVRGVAVLPEGKHIISRATDRTMKIWSVETGECARTLKNVGKDCWRVAVSVDGGTVITSAKANNLGVWDLASGKQTARLSGHTDGVRGVAIAPDGELAISGSLDKTLRVWRLSRGECVATLTGHTATVDAVTIVPGTNRAVSGSYDGTIKVWDIESGRCLSTLEGHSGRVRDLVLMENGSKLASASHDTTVRVWDLRSGQCSIAYAHPGEVYSVACSPDGTTLISGCGDGKVRFWNYRPTAPPAEARRYVNAKVVLLGEGTVGKTSLAHRLIEDQYVIRDRTHGMNVWRMDLPLPPDGTLEREALLWDLAGQEDYRLVHQLFLDETALALLLVNPQKSDPFAEAGDWLKALKSAAKRSAAARSAAALLIFSQTDVGGMKISNAKIERLREQFGFSGWLATSAKTGKNCSDQENSGQPSQLSSSSPAASPGTSFHGPALPACSPS